VGTRRGLWPFPKIIFLEQSNAFSCKSFTCCNMHPVNGGRPFHPLHLNSPLAWRQPVTALEAPNTSEARIIRGLGAEPPAGSRGRTPGKGVSGQSPPKLKHFWLLDVHWESQICPLKNLKRKKSDTNLWCPFKKWRYIGRNTSQITVQ